MRPIPVHDAETFEATARAAFGHTGWYARAGGEPHWPMNAAQAVDFLERGGEYSIDEAAFGDLIRRGIVTPPEDGLWRPGDVVQAGAVLESRRQWPPSPSTHDPKKHPTQLQIEQAATADALDDVLAGNPELDARHIAVLMTECENREVREKLMAGLLATLQRDHGVTL